MVYFKPVRRIITQDDLKKWETSETHALVLGFVEDLQQAVLGKTNNEAVDISEPVQILLNILNRIKQIREENPVLHEKNVARFGKVEFRNFYDQIQKEAPELVKPLVGTMEGDPTIEIASYLTESWGNRTRIDYGSGHELNFVCTLLCLKQLNIITKTDYPALVLRVFTQYMEIMRSLQHSYWLEPAGSHGVWGLDDYHFLPFLFGASQLATHPYMKPKAIHNDELVESYYKQYMYFECIHFINSIKTIPNNQEKLSLRWHSPMLDDISSAKSWSKIKEGMIKMYKAEVLNKLPIIQHFMFGGLIVCPDGVSEFEEIDEEHGHAHAHGHEHEALNTWGDCCGIKVPSAIAASEAMKLMSKNKPVPFD